MRNYKFLIEYDGTRYFGWQRQPNKDTIQGKLEKVLARMCGDETVEIIGAGRTDAGVHARGMVANAAFETDRTQEQIRDYFNRYLPDDIAVKEVRVVSPRFHARYNALGRTYQYTCYEGAVKPVFDRRYYAGLDAPPDLEAMRGAAALLMGTHDFRNFSIAPHKKKSTVRNVDRIEIVRENGYLVFTFHGNSFLQSMVRILVGTLLEVGYGRMTLSEVEQALEAQERQKAAPTAPAAGLCLTAVDY